MKQITTFFILMSVIFFTNCSQSDSEIDASYQVQNKACTNIKGTAYSICLESVEDSRCPSNGICVWEGNATANFVLNSATESTSFTLNTNRKFQRDTIINGLNIELLDVTPYPLLDTTINPDTYLAELKISRK